jgi:prepilin-type N-terminal cleavage/methylation domain-containing protein
MGNRRGFTVLELVIVVAVAGILAAVLIPALIRGRVAANESATIGDIRVIISAQAAYRTANSGFYDGFLDCLVGPSFCIPSYPTSAPTFLDSTLASQVSKAGYHRSFVGGGAPNPVPAMASATSVTRFRYDATPATVGVTGVRGFAGSYQDRICFTEDGAPVPPGASVGELPPNCQQLR